MAPMTTASAGHCDVWELARRGGEVSGELPIAQAARLIETLVDAGGLLCYHFHGRIDELGRPGATLQLEGWVRARCDRCGMPVDVPMHEQAEFYFVTDEAALNGLPIDESPDEPLLGSPDFDLAALIEDQAILALPISPRHDECALPAASSDVDLDTGDGQNHRPFASLAALEPRKK